MRLLIVNGLRRDSSEDLYQDLATRLQARGIAVDLQHRLDTGWPRLAAYDVVFSNDELAPELRAFTTCYGGRPISRPAALAMLSAAGVETMDWTLAHSRREVWRLFARWRVERLLLKPSFTFGGKDVCVFSRRGVWRLRWTSEADVFCREVNPDDGDVYKAELLNGRIVIAWRSLAPPLRTLVCGSFHRGVAGAYGTRELWEPPPALAARLAALSAALTAHGLGYLSVDLMQRSDGAFVAIELNPRGVATWWTRQFPAMRARYADALEDLVRRTPSAHEGRGLAEAPGEDEVGE